MENKQKILSLIGLAKKAGMIITGENLTLKQIQNKKVKLIFIAKDGGLSTLKKFKDKSKTYGVFLDDSFTRLELSNAIGQNRTIIGILDLGFAKKMKELLTF